MEISSDFLAVIQQYRAALAFYATLKRQQLLTSCHGPTIAKRSETWLCKNN
jgi:hypothetical protein